MAINMPRKLGCNFVFSAGEGECGKKNVESENPEGTTEH
jgi:hypothetical protein